MRLIDADDLWSDIMMLPHNGDMISSEEVEQAIKDATTIDPESLRPKWISVKDRLPEIPEGWAECPSPVLYMMKSTKTIYAGYYGENGIYRDKYFRQYADAYEGVDAIDVLCWMWQCDLPEPPDMRGDA